MILVTGASGLVGSHLLKVLMGGNVNVKAQVTAVESINKIAQVFSYYGLNLKDFEDRIEWVYGDIQDISFMNKIFNKVEKVVHCAAAVSFHRKDNKLIYGTNVHGTSNIVNLCLQHEIKKLIHISSIAAIKKNNDNSSIIEENGWPNNKTHGYAKSKTDSEFVVWEGIEKGLHAVIVNPSVILGPGNWASGSSLLFERIYDGTRFFTRGITGFVDVRDVVNIIEILMHSEVHSERFILNGSNVSFEYLFKQMAEKLNVKVPTNYASPIVTEIAWRVAKIISIFSNQQPRLTRTAARASHRVQKYSANKISNRIGYTFCTLEETIDFTCTKFLESISSKFEY